MYKKFFIIALAFLSMLSTYSMNCVLCCGKLHSDADINRIKTAVVQGKIVKSFAHTITDRRKMLKENADTYHLASYCGDQLMLVCSLEALLAFLGSTGSKSACCCGSVCCWKIVSLSSCACCIATSLCTCYANKQRIKIDEHIENLREKPADEIMEETPLLMHTKGEIELVPMS